MMIFIARKRNVVLAVLIVLILLGTIAVNYSFFSLPASGDSKYRVFVAGIGTIEGKWSGETGIAVIGLETRPAAKDDQELKVIDLLVANNSSEKMLFQSDIGLVDKKGRRYELKAKGQTEVSINPGALSQGTVIIGVPKGVPDQDWVLEVKGGNLQDTILLPLKIIKVTDLNSQETD